MTLFILTETSAGYALLKAKDKKLLKREDIATEASTAEGVSNLYASPFLALTLSLKPAFRCQSMKNSVAIRLTPGIGSN
jgi:hypothetical protein